MSDASVDFPATYDGPTYEEAQEGGVVDAPDFPTEDSAPVTDGQGEETVTPDTTYFDPSQFADKLVKLKVQGEDVEMSLQDALNGSMRQADYTRKTQELSFANDLAQSLQADPAGTIAYLQHRFGGQPQVEQEDQWPEDPQERRLAEIEAAYEARLRPIEERAAKDHILGVLGSLEQTYGEDFNRDEVLKAAVARGINDPSQFEAIYQQLAFTRMRGAQLAQQERSSAKAAEDAKREGAKAGIVSHGNGQSPQTAAPTTSIKTFADAGRAAAATLGIDLDGW